MLTQGEVFSSAVSGGVANSALHVFASVDSENDLFFIENVNIFTLSLAIRLSYEGRGATGE